MKIRFTRAISALAAASAVAVGTVATVGISLISDSSYAAETTEPDFCDLNTAFPERHNLGKDLGYYSQALSDDRIMFMGRPDADGARWAGKTPTYTYNLKTRRRVESTYYYDPFPTPDGKYYVHPDPVRFHLTSDIDKLGKKSKPIAGFVNHGGFYQSVAQLPNGPDGSPVYRVLTATSDSNMRLGTVEDYKTTPNKHMNGGLLVSAMNERPVAVCGNVSGSTTLAIPIMSKDGKLVSVYNAGSGTTQLYKIAMPSGSCELTQDLGGATGKGSFSFDGRHYAATYSAGSPPQAVVLVWNLTDLKTLPRVVSPPRTSLTAVFPTFLHSGDLVFSATDSNVGETNFLFRVSKDHLTSTASPLQLSVAEKLTKLCPKSYANYPANYFPHLIDRQTCMAIRRFEKAPKEDCMSIPSFAAGDSSSSKTAR